MKKPVIIVLILTAVFWAFNQKLNAQQAETAPQTKVKESRSSINYDQLIDRYFESLNEADERRRGLIAQIWTADGTFVYPGSEVKGRAAISADVSKVQKMYPRAIVKRTGRIEILEKRYIRFRWEFGVPSEDILISGVDFAVVSEDGKLELVVGYFDFISEKPNNN